MVDTKKEQERAELHKAIWAIANDLRGSVDGWDFKQYVLGMLFYRFISENMENYIDEGEEEDFCGYANMDDKEIGLQDIIDIVRVKGFFIFPSQLFKNVVKRLDDDKFVENLNIYLKGVLDAIQNSVTTYIKEGEGEAVKDNVKGLFADIDFNGNKLGASVAVRNDVIKKVLLGINKMNLGSYENNTIDAFGDAYEFLMGMYASNAGKVGGEYFTPAEVSTLLAKIALDGKTSVNKVYDGQCGSGSLLLKIAKEIGKENIRQGFFGQEKNVTNANLCRINMFLHNIGYDKFDICVGDTLTDPQHWDDEPFECIVGNPPWSVKSSLTDLHLNDPRFSPAGVLPPSSKADWAFVLHALAWLSENGTAAMVCFPGIMYRGGAEQKIRKYLVDNNFVEAVIQLSDNLFFGTSVSATLLILKKSSKKDNNILFIDATKNFVKVGKDNKLSDKNIDDIFKLYKDRQDVQYKTKLVKLDDVAKEAYNLSVSTYVEQPDTREKVDIKVLNAEIEKLVAEQAVLRAKVDAYVRMLEGEE